MIFAAALSLMLVGVEAEGERVYGAPILPGARKLEDGRYAAGRSYDDTLEFYEKLFKGSTQVRFRAIINNPAIKAIHLQNLKGGSTWAGINIYELNGQTRVYVVKGDAVKEPAKKK
jgi:hypothetical protein